MFSFTKRSTATDVHKVMRRVIDTTTPNITPSDDRVEGRSHRTIAVLLAGYDAKARTISDATWALTRDLSSQGVAVLVRQPFSPVEVVVVFAMEDSPRFVRGEVRQSRPLGGGFLHLGIELTDVLDQHRIPALEDLAPLADHLSPVTGI